VTMAVVGIDSIKVYGMLFGTFSHETITAPGDEVISISSLYGKDETHDSGTTTGETQVSGTTTVAGTKTKVEAGTATTCDDGIVWIKRLGIELGTDEL
jgi:hypothetical protein